MSSWNEDIAVLNSLFEAHLAPLMKDFREWGCAVSPTVSWHLRRASQNRSGMSVRRSVVPHQSKNDASHNDITAS
jgi:hypothetical protein